MRQKKIIPTDMQAARQLAEDLLQEVEAKGYSESMQFAIRLALEEALSNAIKHGNRYDPDKSITVEAEIKDDHTAITVADEGEGFDPAAVPDPTADENLEKPSGRGIMLMRAYMDTVQFSKRGNQVSLVKNRC
ncbi:MAG: hypothetical protein AMJ81_12850 [Phycisphaerae bacterium SM23_33]|jgi:serine/threonine-protein kinase RsbW|nr:MAG: hypothetical protein AMJ81_12850 [Phycisphaerae bacterium SM23_33]